VLVDVIVSPRASRTRVMGIWDGRLKITLAAPPADGKVNNALVRFLAREVRVARAQVAIIVGQSSRRKTIRLARVTLGQVLLRLAPRGAE